MLPLLAAAPWSDYLPVLALLGAMAAYIGAIRLWFHKLRMDALDALHKAHGTPEPWIPHQLPERFRRAVWWLRALFLVDLVVLTGAVVLFVYTFEDWLPPKNWDRSRPGNGFAAAIQMMWLTLILLCVAHFFGGVRPWCSDPEYRKPSGSRDDEENSKRGQRLTLGLPLKYWGWYVLLGVVVVSLVFYYVPMLAACCQS